MREHIKDPVRLDTGSLAPVINVSFANAVSDIQRDSLFDIIG